MGLIQKDLNREMPSVLILTVQARLVQREKIGENRIVVDACCEKMIIFVQKKFEYEKVLLALAVAAG